MWHFVIYFKYFVYFCTRLTQKTRHKPRIMAINVTHKQPSECTTIDDVRNEIDNIDREIIRLLGQRFGYVKEVVKYKSNDRKSIEASDRRTAVINTRKQWAEEQGLNGEIIGNIYDQLVAHFIEEEVKIVTQ